MNTPSNAKPRHPVLELLSRYAAIFRAAWAVRHQMAGPTRLMDEVAFLPAALSLQDTPVHPAPRRLAWLIIALFLIALIWAIFGRVDIVAVAPGRIIVSDRTKVIQPLETSVIRRIHVRDGDRVKAGQLLVELDPTMANADKANLAEQIEFASSEDIRTSSILDALLTGREPQLQAFKSPLIRSQLSAEWQDVRARLAKLDAESNRRRAEASTVTQSIAKIEAMLPMAQARENDFKQLVDQGYISSHATQDRTRDRVELERDLATQKARLSEAQLTVEESAQNKASYLAELTRNLQDRNALAASRLQQLKQDQSKVAQRERQTHLVAPVNGIVQQLAVHTDGGVVTEAQQIMVVVPTSAEIVAEVVIENKDIGFVSAGQTATVKLDTYLYTQYGAVSGAVDWLSSDAVVDEKRGAVFLAKLRLDSREMSIDGRKVRLAPGMALTAEIRTGNRRVIDYLLDVVKRSSSESLRER